MLETLFFSSQNNEVVPQHPPKLTNEAGLKPQVQEGLGQKDINGFSLFHIYLGVMQSGYDKKII